MIPTCSICGGEFDPTDFLPMKSGLLLNSKTKYKIKVVSVCSDCLTYFVLQKVAFGGITFTELSKWEKEMPKLKKQRP